MSDPRGGGNGARCRILLIEPDPAYRAAIEACMRLVDCRVDWAASPRDAFALLDRHSVDLVIWGVSVRNAHSRGEVIGGLRHRTEAPLVMVDAGLEAAQLDLEAGADQWLPKPFVPGALIGSVRAALRQATTPFMDVGARIEIYGMVLDGHSRSLRFAGQAASLSREEWTLLSVLVSHPNHFLSEREVENLGWGAAAPGSGLVRSWADRLRRKLQPMTLPCRLLSHPGQGYCLDFN